MTADEQYMQRCLDLAQLGLRKAAPNPSVGCVIVHNNKIIGEGLTDSYGGNHGEVKAINSVKNQSLLAESTMYVSLEPCAHFGKTPPCADLIIRHQLKRVVIACVDSFSEVNGAGIKRLIDAGIDVEFGVLEQEAIELNKRFFTFHQKRRPYIILKWAETADGFVDRYRTSNEGALKITSAPANTLVHKWRTEETGILIGTNTAIQDNPSLTARKYKGPNPTRILLDANGIVPQGLNIFSLDSQTVLITETDVDDHQDAFVPMKVQSSKDLQAVLNALYELKLLSVIVEGGPTLQLSFYEAGLWDEARRFVSPQKIGSGVVALRLKEEPVSAESIGVDTLYTYRHR